MGLYSGAIASHHAQVITVGGSADTQLIFCRLTESELAGDVMAFWRWPEVRRCGHRESYDCLNLLYLPAMRSFSSNGLHIPRTCLSFGSCSFHVTHQLSRVLLKISSSHTLSSQTLVSFRRHLTSEPILCQSVHERICSVGNLMITRIFS